MLGDGVTMTTGGKVDWLVTIAVDLLKTGVLVRLSGLLVEFGSRSGSIPDPRPIPLAAGIILPEAAVCVTCVGVCMRMRSERGGLCIARMISGMLLTNTITYKF